MRVVLTATLLLLVGLVVWTHPRSPNLPTPAPARLFGVVVSDRDERPLPGARVEVLAGDTVLASTTANAHGVFAFVALRPGGVRLRARHATYWEYTETLTLGPYSVGPHRLAMTPAQLPHGDPMPMIMPAPKAR